MPLSLDAILVYLIVIVAVAYMVRPVLYRLIGRDAPSAACHSDAGTACDGGCAGCHVAKKTAPNT